MLVFSSKRYPASTFFLAASMGLLLSLVSALAIDGPYIPPINPYINITFDHIPPVTNISLDGNPGENGWWVSDVTATLSATDPSGIDRTIYSTRGEGQGFAIVLSYQTPFTIVAEGRNTVTFHSVDKVGNVEDDRQEIVKIDKSPPEGSMVIEGSPEYVTSSSVTLVLSASDAVSGVSAMRFKNDEGSWRPWETYASKKIWGLGSGDGGKTVYAQFKDEAGLTSPAYKAEVVLDTQPPEISSPVENGTKTKSQDFVLNWSATDKGSGIDHYEVRLDDGAWTNVAKTTTYTFSGLDGGEHSLQIKAVDKTGKASTYAVAVTISKGFLGGFGLILLIIIIAAAVAAVLIIWWLKKPKKKPEPERIKLSAQPAEIVADGKSTSTITVQLLDKKGKPAEAQTDLEVSLTTTSGSFTAPKLRIPKGQDSGTAVLTSSTKFGSISVSATSAGLEQATMTMTFKEKPRFCMGCGSRMSVNDTVCKNCGASPSNFGGPETKTCHCGAVLPYTAKYCSECGAKQPPMGSGASEPKAEEGSPSGPSTPGSTP